MFSLVVRQSWGGGRSRFDGHRGAVMFLLAATGLQRLAPRGFSPTAAGLALGVGIHLMLSSGAAKLTIGGRAWAAPATMRNVLGTYLKHDGPDGPLLRPLAEAAARSDVAMAAFGGGALFFALAARCGGLAGRAVLSDMNSRLIRTYQTVRDQVEPLIERLREHAALHTKEHYYATRARNIDVDTDVEVAAWMIYLNKTGFNGLYRVNKKGGFNVPMGRYKNPKVCDADNLRACSAVLKGVEIRHQGFDGVLERVGEGDFVYFDPPYVPV